MCEILCLYNENKLYLREIMGSKIGFPLKNAYL